MTSSCMIFNPQGNDENFLLLTTFYETVIMHIIYISKRSWKRQTETKNGN